MILSKRPGLMSAASMAPGLFVAPKTTSPLLSSKPSICSKSHKLQGSAIKVQGCEKMLQFAAGILDLCLTQLKGMTSI